MLLKGIDHITINVKDIQTSFDFYKNILELERLDSVDLDEQTLHYLALPGGARLELIDYHCEKKVLMTENTDIGIYRHIAFFVDSVDELKKRCDMWNIKINLQPTFIEKLKCKVILIEDPNGVEIELVEKV